MASGPAVKMDKPSGDAAPVPLKPVIIDLRHRLEYGALRALVGLVRLMPIDMAANVSGRMWRMIAPRLRRHRRALSNLALAYPEKTLVEREGIARDMWENLGRVMAETMQIDRLILEPDRIQFANEKVFNRYKNKLGPVIGASLHMGNWELAIWPLVVAGADPAAVYRTVKNPYVDAYLRHQRRDLYPGGLFGKGKVDGSREEGQNTARAIMDHVRNGGRLGVVCDLYDKSGLPVPFFGHPAKSVAIPAMLARRCGARIWLARCMRIGKASRFRIDIKELKVPRTGNAGDDVKWITVAMQQQFEAWIRECPEQWMWSNRRWS